MFVGHLSLAFAAKPRARGLNLGWLMAGVCALDLVWPPLVLAGIEHVSIVPGATAFTPLVFDSYPWSHSLVMACLWGLVLAAIARWRTPTAVAGLLFLLVVSHWVLDVATHAPDMPLWPGPSPKFGLGLWYSIPATLIVEGAMWLAGIWIFLRTAPPRTTGARIAFWSFVIICTVMWATGPWGPVPPSERALGWFAMIGWLIVPWAAVADRQRGTA
jgi:membrane-bound metal-dependent hydrolase YbcI (DUF457 family)